MTTRTGETFQVTHEALNTHIIIYDSQAGRDIQLEAGTRLAMVKEQWIPSQTRVTGKRPFSSAFFLAERASPQLFAEDLE